MFIAGMSTIAKLWKGPRCPSTDEWIKKIWFIYKWNITQPSERMKTYLPFALTWMELEGIMLSEIIQSEKDNYHIVSFIRGI